jgi:hypothetical protein
MKRWTQAASGAASLVLAAAASAAGPDVTLLDIQSVFRFGSVTVTGQGVVHGYAISSHTCNMGTANLIWANGGTPALAMNAYRLHNGRLMHIGMGQCKHACCAAAGSGCGLTCNGVGGGQLGAGCLDVYGASYNGGQSRLGPRSGINAFTGQMNALSGTSGDAIFKRLQVRQDDMSTATYPGALYFVEGVYVGTDDAINGSALNNATHRRVTVNSSFDMAPTGTGVTQVPAIRAWRDHGLGVGVPDPSVSVNSRDIPNEGRFWYAVKVRDNGNGTWTYDYAVFNLNSDKAGGSFSLPAPAGMTITNTGWNGPRWHSGETYNNDAWVIERNLSTGTLTFRTAQTFAQNTNANAIRWGAMHNFWFTCDRPPTAGNATLGLFKPHTTQSVTLAGQVPTPPPCNPDLNLDGNVNQDDVGYLINVIGGGANASGIDPDFNRDGNADQDDVSALINTVAGGGCPN